MKAKVRRKNYVWLLAFALWLVGADHVFAQTPQYICGEQNIENLTTNLLRDLPSYANRATQRARRRSRSVDLYSYTLLAGRPEFQPLPLNPWENETEETQNTGDVEQVFFTTLERRYTGGKAVESQQFHWLLLTNTQNGWRLIMMFSQIGDYPQQQLVSPPRDSSNGVVAQAVRTWLRDCQAGSVRFNS